MKNPRDQLVRLVGRGWDQVKGSLYRNAIFIMVTSVISSGLGFFFWLVVSIRYQQADIGAAITLFSTLGFVGVLGFFFSSRRRHTSWPRDWSSDVCSSDLPSICESLVASILRS